MYLKTRDGRQVDVMDIEYGIYPEETQITVAFYCDVESDKDAIVPDSVLAQLTEDNFDRLVNDWYDKMGEEPEVEYDSNYN